MKWLVKVVDKRYEKEVRMKEYHERFMELAHQQIDFCDKIILEVGCGNGEMLIGIVVNITAII